MNEPSPAMVIDHDQFAREILAEHYRRVLGPERAERVLKGPWTLEEDAAIRAVRDALGIGR